MGHFDETKAHQTKRARRMMVYFIGLLVTAVIIAGQSASVVNAPALRADAEPHGETRGVRTGSTCTMVSRARVESVTASLDGVPLTAQSLLARRHARRAVLQRGTGDGRN
jgi:hypothetical protein